MNHGRLLLVRLLHSSLRIKRSRLRMKTKKSTSAGLASRSIGCGQIPCASEPWRTAMPASLAFRNNNPPASSFELGNSLFLLLRCACRNPRRHTHSQCAVVCVHRCFVSVCRAPIELRVLKSMPIRLFDLRPGLHGLPFCRWL